MKSISSQKINVELTPFQKDWVLDDSRYKIAVKARRIGFTFATTLEIARDCARRAARWLIISRTQDTAKEAVREIANHIKAFQVIERVEDSGLRADEIKINKFTIEFPNGSEVVGMTSHPDAARGFGGNVFIDEFGFHRDSYELWKGASASVMRGHRLIVVSTPHYQFGKYYDLVRSCNLERGHPAPERKQGIWATHWVDLHTAAPQLAAIKVPPFWLTDPEIANDPGHENVSAAVAEIRELAGTEDDFQQEYCCQFLSAAEMWISLELIASARSPQATLTFNPDGAFDPVTGRAEPYGGWLYVGADIGRKRDRTAIWIDERRADMAICRGMISLDRKSFEIQYEEFCKVLSHPRVRRLCIDATGIGAGLAERLQEKFGSKVEGVTFTGEAKEDMAIRVRRRMEEKLDKIPMNAPEIERDFAAIKRETTASGNLRFDAARTEAGHADIFWAKALADLAADSGVAAAGSFRQPAVAEHWDGPLGPPEAQPHVSVWDTALETERVGRFA